MKRQQDNLWSYVRHLIAAIVLASLAIGIYSGTYDHPFAFDDANSITENPKIWIKDLQPSTIWKAGTESREAGHRPLAFASFAVNYFFGNENGKIIPSGFHIVNSVIHAINGVLVYFLALLTFRRISEQTSSGKGPAKPVLSFWMALFAAGLFVAHPIQTQAVTYIVQRMTSMATLFYLLALLLYILGRIQPWGALRIALWAGVLLSFGLSWSSKQLALPLLFVIPLYEWFFFQDLSIAWLKRRDVQIVACVAILVATIVGVGALAQVNEDSSWNPLSRLTAGYAKRDFTMAERLYTQPRVVMQYLGLVALPMPGRMSLLHEMDPSTSLISPPTSLLSLLAIVGMIGAAIWFARRQRLLSFALLWFFIHLVIESTVLPLEMIYEHRIYLPFVGVALGVSYLLWTLLARQKLWAGIACCTLIAVLSAATVERNSDWADIYSDIIAKYPNSLRALLGRGLRNLERFDERRPDATMEYLKLAADDFAQIIEIRPDAIQSRPGEKPVYDNHVLDAYVANAEARSILGAPDKSVLDQYAKVESIDPTFDKIYVSRGNFYFRQQKFTAAIEQYSKALKQRLKNKRKREGDQAEHSAQSGDVFYRRAFCYFQQKNVMDAMTDLDLAIKLNEHHLDARFLRGVCHLSQNDPLAAITELDTVLKTNDEHVQARYQRARALLQLTRFREAQDDLLTVLRQNGGHIDAALTLIKMSATVNDRAVRNPPRALRLATRGCERTKYEDHRWLDVLALSQASNGNFAEAIATQNKAIALAPPQFHPQYEAQRAAIEAQRRRPR